MSIRHRRAHERDHLRTHILQIAVADLWKRARWLLDDHGPGFQGRKLKTHRSRARAVEEGGLGGDIDWFGNAAADLHAKELARSRWQAIEETERNLQDQREKLKALVARAAVVGAIAQRQLDAAGIPKIARRPRKAATRGRPSECGDHVLLFVSERRAWECTKCRLVANTATSRRSLAQKRCNGEVSGRIPQSHRLQFSGGVLWCQRCGRFTTRLPRALTRECPGRAQSAAAANILRRLRQGLPPTTAAYLQDRVGPRFIHSQEDDDALRAALGENGAIDKPTSASIHRIVPHHNPHPLPHHDRPLQLDANVAGLSAAEGQATRLRRTRTVTTTSTADEGHLGSSSSGLGRHALSEQTVARQEAAVSDDALWRRRGSRISTAHVAATPAGGASTTSSQSSQPLSSMKIACQPAEPLPCRHQRSSSANLTLCQPTENDPWTRRLCATTVSGYSACHLCGTSSRSRCRGCERQVCLQCAKRRNWCKDVRQDVSG